ncbi:MAG: hypothetical protein FWH27_11055 [Planctomycetaceae bacterium]|nr:hypothetical protein [Planctomycetaceae bacterium]
MVKVYEISQDSAYQTFYTDKGVGPKILSFGLLPEKWKVPKVYIIEPKLPKPNFFSFEGTDDIFVLDEVALEHTWHIFSSSGQLFPFTFKEVVDQKKNHFALFKATHCYDCLDEKKTVYERVNSISRYVFHPKRIHVDTPIFTIPQLNSATLFAIEGIKDNQCEELKYCIDKYKLTGLKLTEVWNDGVDTWADNLDDEEVKACLEYEQALMLMNKTKTQEMRGGRRK